MTANRSVTANFTPVYQNLTIAVDPLTAERLHQQLACSYLEGRSLVTAISAAGYEFAQWNGLPGIGTCTVTADLKSVTAVPHDVVSLAVNVNGSGTVIRACSLYA
jgi:hypothetical protein